MQGGGGDQGFSGNTFSHPVDTTPIYRPEATFSTGTGGIHFVGDPGYSSPGSNGMSDEEMLATMQALKNPAWWQNMMMPG
jgi:hypothetical protein